MQLFKPLLVLTFIAGLAGCGAMQAAGTYVSSEKPTLNCTIKVTGHTHHRYEEQAPEIPSRVLVKGVLPDGKPLAGSFKRFVSPVAPSSVSDIWVGPRLVLANRCALSAPLTISLSSPDGTWETQIPAADLPTEPFWGWINVQVIIQNAAPPRVHISLSRTVEEPRFHPVKGWYHAYTTLAKPITVTLTKRPPVE